MQWPDYLANLLFHSYYFSSNSWPTPSFGPLTQQPDCVASFHPSESSSFEGAGSLFTPSPLFAASGLRCTIIIAIGRVSATAVFRLWIDWLGYNVKNRLWHNLCGRSLYEGLLITRNLPAEIIGSRYPVATWHSDQVHLESQLTWSVQVLRSPKEAFAAAMQSWRERCEKCVCLQGDYIEKWLHFQLPAVSSFF